MPHRYPVGSIMGNGFRVVSSDLQGRKIEVRCPKCRARSWRRPDVLYRMKSCGCEHALNIGRYKRLERHRLLVEKAQQAFATDSGYAIRFARAANEIQRRMSVR